MRPRPHLRELPFDVLWVAETRLFNVYLDDKLVGSHKGRSGADKIGRKAAGTKPSAGVNRPRRIR